MIMYFLLLFIFVVCAVVKQQNLQVPQYSPCVLHELGYEASVCILRDTELL